MLRSYYKWQANPPSCMQHMHARHTGCNPPMCPGTCVGRTFIFWRRLELVLNPGEIRRGNEEASSSIMLLFRIDKFFSINTTYDSPSYRCSSSWFYTYLYIIRQHASATSCLTEISRTVALCLEGLRQDFEVFGALTHHLLTSSSKIRFVGGSWFCCIYSHISPSVMQSLST